MKVEPKETWIGWPRAFDKCETCGHLFKMHDTEITMLPDSENWNCLVMGCECPDFIERKDNA